MEQRRTLWIVAAVGLFLLIVIGAALIIYAPERNNLPFSKNKSTEVTPQVKPTDFLPIYDENEEIFVDKKTDKIEDKTEIDVTVVENNISIDNNPQTIDLNKINVGQPAVTKAAEPQKTTNTSTPAPKVDTKPVSQVSVASSSKRTSSTTSTTKPSSTSAKTNNVPSTTSKVNSTSTTTAASKPISSYWIQVSAYSSKKNAEEARNILNEAKIPSEIFTYTDAKGTLFFRVRVGPYTTKSEAEYWQTRIKAMSKFQDTKTYITDATAKAN